MLIWKYCQSILITQKRKLSEINSNEFDMVSMFVIKLFNKTQFFSHDHNHYFIDKHRFAWWHKSDVLTEYKGNAEKLIHSTSQVLFISFQFDFFILNFFNKIYKVNEINKSVEITITNKFLTKSLPGCNGMFVIQWLRHVYIFKLTLVLILSVAQLKWFCFWLLLLILIKRLDWIWQVIATE